MTQPNGSDGQLSDDATMLEADRPTKQAGLRPGRKVNHVPADTDELPVNGAARTMRRIMMLVVVSAALAAVWWYFGVLLERTEFATRRTGAGNDALQLMYLACGFAVSLASYIVLRRIVHRVIGFAILGAAVVPMIGFAWLNLSERVCMSKKASQCIPLLSPEYPFVNYVYDAAAALGLR